MTTAPLSLAYSKTERQFTGFGYKSIPRTDILYLDEHNPSDFKLSSHLCSTWSKDWCRSTARQNKNRSPQYSLGFHIFQEIDHAVRYDRINAVIFRVEYKYVISYGTQSIIKNKGFWQNYFNFDAGSEEVPCIVSHYMRIIGAVLGSINSKQVLVKDVMALKY